MKKGILLILLSISTILLVSCSSNPFTAPAGTEIVESDTISFTYYNGVNSEKLFEYTFSNEYFYFIGPLGINYSFTTINNYLEISDEFIAFLEYYEGNIVYDKYLNDSYGDELKLSLGATDGNYNLSKISIDNNIYDVDAYISIENGLKIIFSYTQFYHDEQLIIVPYHLAIIAYDIHELYLKEYLPADNDYVSEKAILTKYITHIIPLPSKVGFLSSFHNNDDLKDLGYYSRIIIDNTSNVPHIEEVCSDTNTENCFEKQYSILEGIIYNMHLNSVITFYQDNYNGRYIEEDFIFTINNENYKIVLISGVLQIDYSDQAGTTEDIVNFEITKYDD